MLASSIGVLPLRTDFSSRLAVMCRGRTMRISDDTFKTTSSCLYTRSASLTLAGIGVTSLWTVGFKITTFKVCSASE